MFFHEGIGFKYNLIQPAALNRSTEDGTPLSPPVAPHVQAPYYGAIVIAEFLGTDATRTMVELSTSSSSIISAYALYTSTGLMRVLLINHQAFLSSSGTARPTVNVALQIAGGPKTAITKSLSGGFSDTKGSMTWGGQSYDTSDGRPTGTIVTGSLVLSNSVSVPAGEVVMVSF